MNAKFLLSEHQHENSRSKNNVLNRSENLKRSTFLPIFVKPIKDAFNE